MRSVICVLTAASLLGGIPLCCCSFDEQACGTQCESDSSVGSSNPPEVDCGGQSCSPSEVLDQSPSGVVPCEQLAGVCPQNGRADGRIQASKVSPGQGHKDLLAIAVNPAEPTVHAGVRHSQDLLPGSHCGMPVRLHVLYAVFLL